MDRSGSTVVRFVVGTAVLLLVGVTVIFGPRLYRSVREVVDPVVDLTRVEERLAGLNEEFPFAPDPGGAIDETRLQQFLEIRRELRPAYEAWDAAVEAAEQQGESWQSVTSILTLTRDVLHGQIDALTRARMSPAEFVWIEDLVYRTWAEEADDAVSTSAAIEAVRETTEADLETLAELERRYGRSKSMTEFAAQAKGVDLSPGRREGSSWKAVKEVPSRTISSLLSG